MSKIIKSKPRSIELIDFEEEMLPSGRKLLHCIFKSKYGDFCYRWTPLWKGVERLLFKALEIEEYNDYEGVWTKELKEVSRKIRPLNEMRLPVTIGLREIAVELERCKIKIEFCSDEKVVYKKVKDFKSFIGIGNVLISWDLLKKFLLDDTKNIEDISEIKKITCFPEVEPNVLTNGVSGIYFYIWLKKEERSRLEIMSKEIFKNIRIFFRKHLADAKALEQGFKEN